MSVRTVAAMTMVVVLAGVAAATPAGALVEAGGPASVATASNGSNASFGAAVSAFMQASSAETEGEVDNGMFAAKFDDTDDRSAKAGVVNGRTAVLQQRLDELRAERDALLNDSESENVDVSDRARAARLETRIEILQRAVNQTEAAARQVGVGSARFDDLRENTRNLSGPEVSALATGLADNPGRGPVGEPSPPTDRGRDLNGNDPAASNGTDSKVGRNNTSDEAPGGGPPENPGNGPDRSGNGEGPPDEAADGESDDGESTPDDSSTQEQ